LARERNRPRRRPWGTWEVRYSEGARRLSRSFATEAEAADFASQLRERQRLGAHAPAAASSMSLEAWLQVWWDRRALGWEANTRRQRASLLDRWIVPFIGHVPLRDLGAERVYQYRAEVVAAGCPREQANKAIAVLSAALGERSGAIRARLLPGPNPCRDIDPLPPGAPARNRRLTPSEVERIAAELDDAGRLLWRLMAYAGLRPQEAQALTWDAVSLSEAELLVDRAADGQGGVKATKGRRTRTVPLVAPLLEDLAAARPVRPGRGALVAPAPGGGMVRLDNWRTRQFEPACLRAGVVASPKDGRTTYAALRRHERADIYRVSAALGHSSIAVTERNYLNTPHYAEAELPAGQSMEEAIRAARATRSDAEVTRDHSDGAQRGLRRAMKTTAFAGASERAGDGTRTRDPQLGRLTL
jgi:integrase